MNMKKSSLVLVLFMLLYCAAPAVHADDAALSLFKQYAHSTNSYRANQFHHARKSSQYVFIIEDAHANEPVQKEIKRILKRLTYGIVSSGVATTPLVLQEGGSYGAIDTSILKKGIRTPEIERYLDQKFAAGEIGAAEHLHALKGGFTFFGIEDTALYNQNYSHFMEIAKLRDEITRLIDDFEDRFAQLRELIFTHELKEFYTLIEKAATDDDLDLAAYLTELRLLSLQYEVKMKRFPTILRYFETLEALQKTDLEKLGQELVRFNTAHGTQHEITHVHELYSSEQITLKTYPLLYSYGKLNTLLLATEMVAFVKEKEALENKLFVRIAYTDEEKDLVATMRKFFILKKILSFTLTKEEYTYYATESTRNKNILKDVVIYLRSYFNEIEIGVPVSTLLESAEGFYISVSERDAALTKNIVKAMDENNVTCAIAVIGGFHTDGITSGLKEKNVSFLVLSPRVKEFDEDGADTYYTVMQRFWQGE
jgi:hypothetical protein